MSKEDYLMRFVPSPLWMLVFLFALPFSGTSEQSRDMKRLFILILIVFTAGCSSSKNSGASGTSMQGMWTVTGNFNSQHGDGSGTYQVALVSSPCSVTSPVGTFTVDGPVCFIANNNSGQGSISGKGLLSSAKNTGEGILIGAPSNPVPANVTINLLFVLGDANGSVVEFTGSGTVTNGTMTGSGSCSSSTPLCQGVSGTFSGTLQ